MEDHLAVLHGCDDDYSMADDGALDNVDPASHNIQGKDTRL